MALKGHTKIELTDVNTGKIDTYENDNMVTNAVAKLLIDYGTGIVSEITDSTDNFFHDYFGGMLLFKNTLEEDVNAYFPPSDNEIVGNAAYDASPSPSTNPYMGTYNAIESHVDTVNKSVTFVYDFTTSQANGHISAISLTSLNAGHCMPFGIKHGTDSSFARDVEGRWAWVRRAEARKPYGSLIESANKPFLTSFTNDCIYTWRLDNANTLVIGKSRLYFSSIGILDSQWSDVVEDIVTITLNGLSDTNTYGYNYDRHTDKLYIMCTNNIEHDSTVKYIEYDVTHQTGSVKSFTNQFYGALDMNHMYVNKGKLYVHIGSGRWGTINLSNTADVEMLNGYMFDSSVPDNAPPFAMGDYVYCEWGNSIHDGSRYRAPLYVMDDTHISSTAGLMVNDNNSGFQQDFNPQRYIPCVESDLLFVDAILPEGGINIRRNFYNAMCMYLATINNLETPVVKTSDKTMKITYTLTETE
jgi:hypothetical protein